MAKKTIKTPVGKINIGIGTTPSSGVTVSMEEIRKDFKKIAKEKLLPVELLQVDVTQKEKEAPHSHL